MSTSKILKYKKEPVKIYLTPLQPSQNYVTLGRWRNPLFINLFTLPF